MSLLRLLITVVGCGVACSTATAGVSLLAVSSSMNVSGLTGQTESSMAVGLHYLEPAGLGFSTARHRLFSGAIIAVGDVGNSLISNSSRDAEFVGFISLLTNGTPEVVVGSANPGNIYLDPLGGGSPEANFFALPEGADGVDFHGFTIDHINFFVESFAISSTPSEFSETGIFTDYNLSGFFQIYGEKTPVVPEPSSCGLMVFGIVSLLTRRRREDLRTVA